MTTPPGLPARALSAAADEALTEASFLTADFAEAERLFTEARALAAREGDRAAEALAISGLGLTQTGQTQERHKISGVIGLSVVFLRADVGNNGFKLFLGWNISDGLLRFLPFCFNSRKG